MTTGNLPRVTRIGLRKGNRPVIKCPECGYKVGLNRNDEIDTHEVPIPRSRSLKRCTMSGKAVHLHIPSERPESSKVIEKLQNDGIPIERVEDGIFIVGAVHSAD